jgi:predicted component of type VI protein secretion system
LITDKELAEKYDLSPADWQNITKDKALGRAIRAERERRLLNGTAARESAARHFVRAPTVLAGIMDSETSNPRHVIEAAKEIRAVATAGNGADNPMKGELFSIVINLGEDCVTRKEFDLAPDKARRLEEKSDGDE